MPIYEYQCPKCGEFEHSQSIKDAPLAKCPKCRSKVTKLISASAFQLKGGGWYSDAYQKKSNGAAKSSEPAASDSTSKEAAPKAEPVKTTTSSAD